MMVGVTEVRVKEGKQVEGWVPRGEVAVSGTGWWPLGPD